MMIDAYLDGSPPLLREPVAVPRALVDAVAPDVVERIKWNMPVTGRSYRWVAVASQRSRVSVYLDTSGNAVSVVAVYSILKPGKGRVNIPDRAELPLAQHEPAIMDVLFG
jgi:uncharacterized protein YdhG (YjbR/CyaY superfamily)